MKTFSFMVGSALNDDIPIQFHANPIRFHQAKGHASNGAGPGLTADAGNGIGPLTQQQSFPFAFYFAAACVGRKTDDVFPLSIFDFSMFACNVCQEHAVFSFYFKLCARLCTVHTLST
jgi:hypothetical protein